MRAFETWQYLKRTGRLPPRDEREWARREFLNLTKYGAHGAEGTGVTELTDRLGVGKLR